ncbi:MAG: NAD(P)-binding domain-containing protein [Micrococcaceae bacterium]
MDIFEEGVFIEKLESEMSQDFQDLPVVVIGAGPIGIAGAVHLQNRGLKFVLFEQSEKIAGAVEQWRHVSLFSPWKRNVDELSIKLLEKHGYKIPDMNGNPTGSDFIDEYLAPLAATDELTSHIKTGVKVIAVARMGVDKLKMNDKKSPFVVRVKTKQGIKEVQARGIIDASGTWRNPNPLGASGIPAIGELENQKYLAGTLPDVLGSERARFADKRVLVVGNGYSAANTILALTELVKAAPKTKIYWAIRGKSVKHFYNRGHLSSKAVRWKIGQQIKELVETSNKLQIVNQFAINSFTEVADGVEVSGDTPEGKKSIVVDIIANGTGFRPNFDIHKEIYTDFDAAVEAPTRMLTFMQSTADHPKEVEFAGATAVSHPQSDFYVIGMKSYGRLPGFFLFFGYEQARVAVAALANDLEAAGPVTLKLPWNIEKY